MQPSCSRRMEQLAHNKLGTCGRSSLDQVAQKLHVRLRSSSARQTACTSEEIRLRNLIGFRQQQPKHRCHVKSTSAAVLLPAARRNILDPGDGRSHRMRYGRFLDSGELKVAPPLLIRWCCFLHLIVAENGCFFPVAHDCLLSCTEHQEELAASNNSLQTVGTAAPAFVFHQANAYEEGQQVVVDCVRYPDMPDFKQVNSCNCCRCRRTCL